MDHKIYDKRDNFDFDIITVLNGGVPHRATYCVYIHKFSKHFLNFIADTFNKFPDLMLC